MNKYDVAVSIGFTCKPAFYLKISGLRKFSSPMDWLTCSIDSQIKLYKNKFNDFFNEYKTDYDIPKVDEEYIPVRDTKYDILTMHHVRKDIPLNEAVEEFEKQFMEQNGDNLCASLIMKRRLQGKNCNDLVGETASIIESLL